MAIALLPKNTCLRLEKKYLFFLVRRTKRGKEDSLDNLVKTSHKTYGMMTL